MSYASREELVSGSQIPLRIVETPEDVFYAMALDMYDTIKNNNDQKKRTVLIVPVGPVGQYRRLAMLINRYGLNMENTYWFNMDEYLDDSGSAVHNTHPLSFEGTIKRELFDRIDDGLKVPPENQCFPSPENIAGFYDRMQSLGGVDVCFGGIGINGHVAFNEPPEPGELVTDEDFMALGGRSLDISRETITINASFSTNGDISAMPARCCTVGMKEILAARKIKLYMCRDWQAGILRRVALGPSTCKVPASLLRHHRDVEIIVSENLLID